MRTPRDLALAMQRTILREAAEKLRRPLSPQESRFVTSRLGLIALEAIIDTVRASGPAELEKYLNSERA